ncbi:DUF2167 domain-containing protein [Brevibacillus agri]|nr:MULTISPECIES: DUF2167 domain-containing protein [Brevibacillus]EJL43432.1 putative membrane-anchored protein [Brevibacillus sp. CF112]MBG9567041.1 membrane-anchored protein [Brevibacillus agri]MED1645705.1 DUF2167 domain-containing protein [Brevibacillus agri]MED1652883.1 DUF2167 domain-containing protein [Brevibacillus agri]MED1686994.1 DUF2167 domain-containing protein [Brevibacillus agri]
MRRQAWLSSLFACMFAFAVVLPASAAGNYNIVESGTKVEMEGKFSFTVPENMIFLNKDDTIKMEQEHGDIPTMNEIGSVHPIEDNQNWALFIEYEDTGHISDDEQNEIDAEALLQSYKDGTEEGNKQRKPEEQFHVIGWNVKPSYNAATHELEYSMLAETAQKDQFLNYKLQVLTRTGHVSFILVTDVPSLVQDKQTLRDKILKNFVVKEGHRYTDFNAETDKVAEFGLTGLILGGLGVAAAKKLGLLALILAFAKKGWILIVVALGALGGLVKKLLNKKKNGQPPADSDEEKPSA